MSATPRSRLTQPRVCEPQAELRNEMPVELCGKRGQPLCTARSLWRDIPSWGTPNPPRRCWGPLATTAPSRKRSKRLCQSGSRLGEKAPWVGHRPGRIIFTVPSCLRIFLYRLSTPAISQYRGPAGRLNVHVAFYCGKHAINRAKVGFVRIWKRQIFLSRRKLEYFSWNSLG